MARVIKKYTLSKQEQRLWEQTELRGWREAMEAFIEDEAREEGFAKYAIYDKDATLLVKDQVSTPGDEMGDSSN